MNLFLKTFLAVGILIAVAGAAYADVNAVSVFPQTKTIVLSRGESADGVFTAVNTTDETQCVNILPRYWHMVEENRDIPIDSWFKISTTEFDLQPRENKEIPFTVTVPEEAIGELAVMVAFKPKPKENQSLNIVYSVSVYVVIKDTEKIDCKLADFKLKKPADRKALTVEAELKNDGNVHVKPRCLITIKNILGEQLGRGALDYGKSLYPRQAVGYQGGVYNLQLTRGIYKAIIDIEYTNIIGKLRREIYFIAGDDGRILLTFFRRSK